MSTRAVELRRKAVHVAMGLFALLLRDLTWRQAALAALAAFTFNLLVLPRVGGHALDRERDAERGWPLGILLYPLVVLALILLFRERPAIAAAGWAYLAFGDGCATLAGVLVGGARLPWNPGKSVAGLAGFVLCGGGTGLFLFGWVSRRPVTQIEAAAVLGGGLVAALLESLPSEIDDNLVAPLAGAAMLAALLPAKGLVLAPLVPALAVNVLAPALAVALGVIRPSGAVAGGLLGAALWIFGGLRLYALLWLFFLLGTATTRFRRARKEAMGRAEEKGGRRGAANVLANGGAAGLFALLAAAREPAWPWLLAAAAALATAAMDTVGTEVGQAVVSPTVLLPDFRRVPPGTDGAVSVAGTLAGLLAAGFVVAAGSLLGLYGAVAAAGALAAAAAGTTLESLLQREGAAWRMTNGHVVNLFTTAIAGCLAAAFAFAFAGGAS